MFALQHLIPAPGASLDWPSVCAAIPALAQLDKTPQSPRTHPEGDAGEHTRQVMAHLLAHPDYAAAAAERRAVLFFASLLHDLGKATCTQVGEGGDIHSRGHSRRGELDARVLLWRAGAPFALREEVCRLIGAHQFPLHAFKLPSEAALCVHLHRLSWELSLSALLVLAEVDLRGRGGEVGRETLVEVEMLRVLAAEQDCLEQGREAVDGLARWRYQRRGGRTPLEQALPAPTGSRVTLMCGLPGSGKNTWVEAHRAGLPVLSYDDTRDGMGLAYGQDESAVTRSVRGQGRELLRQRAAFVWNATHLSAQMRTKALTLLFDYDADVEIVYIEASAEQIASRLARRESTISAEAFERLLQRWEVPRPTEAPSVLYAV